MVRDRLLEFQNKMTDGEQSYSRNGKENSKKKKQTLVMNEEEIIIQELLAKVEEIHDRIAQLRSDVDTAKKFYDTSPASRIGASEKIGWLVSKIRNDSKGIHNMLKNLREVCQKSSSPTVLRIGTTQHSAFLQEFLNIMHSFQNVQIKYGEQCKKFLKLQYDIANLSPSGDEDLEDEESYSVFTQNILSDTRLAEEALQDIKIRHQEITKVEKSVEEIHALFSDLTLLVENQGETINNIESNVNQSLEQTYKGKDELGKAKKQKKKLRKRKLKFAVVGIGVAALATTFVGLLFI